MRASCLLSKEGIAKRPKTDNKTTARTLCCQIYFFLTKKVYSKSASIHCLLFQSCKNWRFFLWNNIVNASTHHVFPIENPLILIGIATKLGISRIKSKEKQKISVIFPEITNISFQITDIF